jgi:SAM-dependent methyltransferase
VTYARWGRRLPRALRRAIFHFECVIDAAVTGFAASLPAGTRVLDAGAGEGQYAHLFTRHQYLGVDLGIGDTQWNYAGLDVVADLSALPLRDGCCGAAVNIVTLEHVPEPARVLAEIARVLQPGAPLLLIVPHEWEEHQQPHDYFRYTRYGVRYLLEQAGYTVEAIQPAGGFFRLLARRLWNAVQFFPAVLKPFVILAVAPAALVLPWFDGLDRTQAFTVGFVARARRLPEPKS